MKPKWISGVGWEVDMTNKKAGSKCKAKECLCTACNNEGCSFGTCEWCEETETEDIVFVCGKRK